jgi:hypothetical protein
MAVGQAELAMLAGVRVSVRGCRIKVQADFNAGRGGTQGLDRQGRQVREYGVEDQRIRGDASGR